MLYVHVTVQLGDVISAVQEVLSGSAGLSIVIQNPVTFGALNIVQWLLIEIKWRFSDDYIAKWSK